MSPNLMACDVCVTGLLQAFNSCNPSVENRCGFPAPCKRGHAGPRFYPIGSLEHPLRVCVCVCTKYQTIQRRLYFWVAKGVFVTDVAKICGTSFGYLLCWAGIRGESCPRQSRLSHFSVCERHTQLLNLQDDSRRCLAQPPCGCTRSETDNGDGAGNAIKRLNLDE